MIKTINCSDIIKPIIKSALFLVILLFMNSNVFSQSLESRYSFKYSVESSISRNKDKNKLNGEIYFLHKDNLIEVSIKYFEKDIPSEFVKFKIDNFGSYNIIEPSHINDDIIGVEMIEILKIILKYGVGKHEFTDDINNWTVNTSTLIQRNISNISKKKVLIIGKVQFRTGLFEYLKINYNCKIKLDKRRILKKMNIKINFEAFSSARPLCSEVNYKIKKIN